MAVTDGHAQEIPSSSEQASSSHFYSILFSSILYFTLSDKMAMEGGELLTWLLHCISAIFLRLLRTLSNMCFTLFFSVGKIVQ